MDGVALALLTGLLTALSIIVAIGAQNAYVLRLGITGSARAILAVVLICVFSDIALITVGILGVGVVVTRLPLLLVILRFVGAAFLVGYSLLAARRAWRPKALLVDAGPGSQVGERLGSVATTEGGAVLAVRPATLRATIVPAILFTWLNPHVYLDTVLLLGTVGNQQGPDLRWWWAAGAMCGSALWFFALGFGARWLRPVFAKPAAWRVLDGCIAVVMIVLGVRLALGA